MKEETKLTLRREWFYLMKYALRRYLSSDLRVGLIAGIAIYLAANSDAALRKGSHLLDVAAALGVAVLAVVIAAISILTVFLTEDYGIILRATYPDDVGEVFYPYRLIAFVSCATTFTSVLGLFVWPAAPPWAREILLALSLGLATWATLGTFDLVRITAGHGRLKMRLPELDPAYVEELKAFLDERKKKAA